MTDYSGLKAELALTKYAGMTDPQIQSSLNANSISLSLDTDGRSVRGVLYPRGSWDRIESVASGQMPTSAITPAVGVTVTQVVVICINLVKLADQDSAIPMSISPVAAKVQSDLTILAASKLSDGKGLIWASGELQSGDPGDAAVLLATLVQGTTSRAFQLGFSGGVAESDILAARSY